MADPGVHQLVKNNIINQMVRELHEPEIQVDVSARGTAPPSRSQILYRNSFYAKPMRFRQSCHSVREIDPCFSSACRDDALPYSTPHERPVRRRASRIAQQYFPARHPKRYRSCVHLHKPYPVVARHCFATRRTRKESPLRTPHVAQTCMDPVRLRAYERLCFCQREGPGVHHHDPLEWPDMDCHAPRAGMATIGNSSHVGIGSTPGHAERGSPVVRQFMCEETERGRRRV